MTGGTPTSYTYTDTTYKDRLTGYNGQSITYDTLGNPLSYLGKTLTWTGRELSTYNNGTLTTYKYDASGIRLSKTTGGTVTNYLYNGSQLIRETKGTDTIWYLYDQNGMIGFTLNGDTYLYVRNLQGDVTKVIGAGSGTVYAEYAYDAWGKCTILYQRSAYYDPSIQIGTFNSIRYRGYYYDVESSFYYLNSRYYDPEVGRFISPDVVAEGGNLYAYCMNDPVNRLDASGYKSFFGSMGKWFKDAGESIKTGAVAAFVAVSNGLSSAYDAVSGYVSDTFGLATYAQIDKELALIDSPLVGSEAGVNAGGIINGNGDKPIVFHTKVPAQAWKFWEYKVGVKANIGNGGFALGYGLLESSTTIDWGGSSVELFGGVDRIGYTVAYDTDFKQGSVGVYETDFIRPWPILVYVLLYVASGGAVGVPQFA